MLTNKLFSQISLTVFLAWNCFSFPNPVFAQEKILRTLTVQGEGVEMIPTTLVQVRLGVEIQGQTATQVQEEVAAKTTALVKLLRSRQVQQLETNTIRLQANYDYSDNQRRLIGYIGTNTVSFRLPTAEIGNILDEAVKVGATRIDGVSFTATEEAIALAQKQALQEAVINAQAQANSVLSTLKLTAKEILTIQINQANASPPRVYSTARAADAKTTPVIGGEQRVTASVTLQISY